MYTIILLLSCIISLMSILLLKIKKIETQVLLFGLVFLTSYSFYFILLVVQPDTIKTAPLSYKIPIVSIDSKSIILPKPQMQPKTQKPHTIIVKNNNLAKEPKIPKGNFCKNCFRDITPLSVSPFKQTQENICKFCSPNFNLIY